MTTKKTITLSIAILYGLLSFVFFSEEFAAELLEVKKNYYLTVTKNFEELNFTTDHWQQMSNKKEFKLNNHYYDVKKIKRHKDKVTVTVVKDEYENIIKYISKHISAKNKKGKVLKSKKALDICFAQTVLETNATTIKSIQHNFPLRHLFSKSHPKIVFHPPCV